MILFCIFVIYFTLREIGEISLKGWDYWQSYWSWIEWFIIGTSVSAVGFYFYKTFVTNKLLDIFSKTFGNGYMKLQHVALVDEFYGYHLGLLIFFANIKLLKILKFNHKMSLLIYTLARCWGDLSGFLGIFFMAFGAFVQMFYLILYCELDDFKTLVRTFETCFTMMLNKFKFGKLKETSTVAAVMFFFFAVCVNWILVNVLLTIIIEGYERVKKELEGKGNELEVREESCHSTHLHPQVIQYIRDAARSLAGRGPRPDFLVEYAPDGRFSPLNILCHAGNVSGPDTGELVVEKGSGAAREGEEDDDDEEHTVVNELPNKVDEFLEYVNRIYFDSQLDLGTKSVLKADLKKEKEDVEEQGSSTNEEENENDGEMEEDWESQLAEAERLGDAYFGM